MQPSRMHIYIGTHRHKGSSRPAPNNVARGITMLVCSVGLMSSIEWFRYDAKDNTVTRIFCAFCSKYQDRLQGLRSYILSFIKGIVGTALKKDSVKKHSSSDMHRNACDMERRPSTTLSYRSTEKHSDT